MNRRLSTLKRCIKTVLARAGVLDALRRPFVNLEFETTAHCNRQCVYCPVSKTERLGDERSRYMRESTFEKLLRDLRTIDYAGLIAPHLYGEPLTDPRFTDWVSRIRRALPRCTIRVVTNGDFLNRERYAELISAGVSYFDVSKHGERLATGLEALLYSLSDGERRKRVIVQDFFADYREDQDLFCTRGGEIALRVPKVHPILCPWVTYPVINTFGDVLLCCMDYHSRHRFGNINERGLIEIWRSPENLSIRRRIYRGHFDLEICRNCFI